MKTTSNGRQPLNSKVEYIRNNLLDPTQILNWSFDYQTKIFKLYKQRQPPKKDLKILKIEYFSDHCMDCDLWDFRGKVEGNSEENLSVAMKVQCWSLWVVRGKLEENSKEI
jgi:hypothetical protein